MNENNKYNVKEDETSFDEIELNNDLGEKETE